ncbi:MAG TPA: GNAT family N-acetyltransferase [Steroidobacteraceae bacterium]|nr:GNAT family N-acetyltransferase [Steroidobacteraceae bacterium]
MKKPAKPKKKSPKAKKSVGAKKLGAAYYAQSKRLGFRLVEAGDEALYTNLFTDAKALEHFMKPLSREAAKQSFDKAVRYSRQTPWKQRVTVIVSRGTQKPLGIASIRLVSADNRTAEVGILLKPGAQAKSFASEASTALLNSAFRRYGIDGIVAAVAEGHKIGELLVKRLGYARGDQLAPSGVRGVRTEWTMSREEWASNYK